MDACANFAHSEPDPVRLDLETWLITASGERIKATVLDISRTGVGLRVAQPILVGEAVELELGCSAFAKVVICRSQGSEARGTFVGMQS